MLRLAIKVEGGLAALFDLSFQHATTKTWEYFRKFGFFRIFFGLKIYPTPAKSLFENTMGNPFFDFVQYWPKLFIFFRIEMQTFSFQICFWNQFSTLGSGQTENTQIRVLEYFQFDHFPKIDSESRFEMRMSIFLF